jgi:hypothetical protein
MLAFPVLANVGATSASVTSTDPTNPSSDVQQQSAGFVAQNQQLQNAPNGIVLPGTATGAAANGAAAGKAKDENAKDGAANGTAAAQKPAPPPPPPPTYVSNIRPLNPVAESTASEPAPNAKAETPSAATATVSVVKPAVPPMQRKPPQVPQIAVAPKPRPAVAPVREAPAPAADPGGGRGAASDGYTFYFGLAIAAALLALALVTFLRIGRGEAPR